MQSSISVKAASRKALLPSLAGNLQKVPAIKEWHRQMSNEFNRTSNRLAALGSQQNNPPKKDVIELFTQLESLQEQIKKTKLTESSIAREELELLQNKLRRTSGAIRFLLAKPTGSNAQISEPLNMVMEKMALEGKLNYIVNEISETNGQYSELARLFTNDRYDKELAIQVCAKIVREGHLSNAQYRRIRDGLLYFNDPILAATMFKIYVTEQLQFAEKLWNLADKFNLIETVYPGIRAATLTVAASNPVLGHSSSFIKSTVGMLLPSQRKGRYQEDILRAAFHK